MFNVTVIKLKDIIKYLLVLTIILLVIFGIKRYFFRKKIIDFESITLKTKEASLFNIDGVGFIKQELPALGEIADDKENSSKEFDFFTSMIKSELGVVGLNFTEGQDSKENETLEDETEQTEEINQNEEIALNQESNKEGEKQKEADVEIKTEVITKNPLVDKYTDMFKSVKIKNETNFNLANEISNIDEFEADKTNVIIFHTHTCESYTSSETYSYIPTRKF